MSAAKEVEYLEGMLRQLGDVLQRHGFTPPPDEAVALTAAAASDPLMSGEVPPVTVTSEQKEKLEAAILDCKTIGLAIRRRWLGETSEDVSPLLTELQTKLTAMLGLL